MKKILIKWSPALFGILVVLAAIGYYLGAGIQLKLSLTDLLPENHPAVVKFEKLTEVVGGVGYFTIILEAADGESHLAAAPGVISELKKSPLVRDAFINREQRFFTDRLMYYVPLDKLKELEKNIVTEIRVARKKAFDLGLWEEDPNAKHEPAFNDELKEHAKKSAGVTPYLLSKDKKHLLLMVKPSFDSMELAKTEELMLLSQKLLGEKLPKNVTYEFAERYYTKVVETKMIEKDIMVSGTLSILFIALLIFIYLRNFRALVLIFIPVFLGLGIMVGLTRLMIGHINIITGFLMGIVSGLGVDYGIHLYLRLKLEKREPSSDDPNPVWRTIASSGHSIFVGAVAASVAFFLLCFSDFRAFSEFGLICGIGITAVLVCLLTSFSAIAKLLKLDTLVEKTSTRKLPQFPVLSVPRGLIGGLIVTVVLIALGSQVKFEYDFNKMLQHSAKMEAISDLVDAIYERSNTPSAISAPTKPEALAVEDLIKKKYMPHLVSELISGATIIPEDQEEKKKILVRIDEKLRPIQDEALTDALGIPASVIRLWMKANPFTFSDLPSHLQDALRGTKQEGFLIYIYPAIKLGDAHAVRTYAAMIKDVETQFPNVLTGSDAVIFSDILDLIGTDGFKILLAIFIAVGLFIWANVRNGVETLMSYSPLLIALLVGMGLMALFGVKFNIFNIAIIPTFVAMGIDVPIHIVHRAKEVNSGHKAVRDLTASINLALLTAGVGFGVLVFARAGVLKSLGWIAILGSLAIWWVGMFVLPAMLEWNIRRKAKP